MARLEASADADVAAAGPTRSALTSPLLPLAVLAAGALALLAARHEAAAVCAAAAVAGVALSGST